MDTRLSRPNQPPKTATSTTVTLEQAIKLTEDPDRRKQGIALLAFFAETAPQPRGARHALARALYWDGRLAEARRVYDDLLRQAPAEDSIVLRTEQLEIMLALGETAEAEVGYRRLLEEAPANTDALVGHARALRWLGRPLAARTSAERALALAPDRRDATEELAWTYADVGLAHAAEVIVGQGEAAASPPLHDRLADLREPVIAAEGAFSGNSAGVSRFAQRATAGAFLLDDCRLLIGGGASRVEHGGPTPEAFNYGVLAAAVRGSFGHLRLATEGATYLGSNVRLFDALASIGIHPVDELTATLSLRHRPFLEIAPPLATDDRSFYDAGVGGAQLLKYALALSVKEAALSLGSSPSSFSYLYLDARGMIVSDGNRGYSVTAGLGFDLLGAIIDLPIALVPQWESYVIGFQQANEVYYSPPLLDTHSAGIELRVRLWKLDLGATAGRTLALIEPGAAGSFVAGKLNLTTRFIRFAIRGDYRASPTYASWRGWLSIEVNL